MTSVFVAQVAMLNNPLGIVHFALRANSWIGLMHLIPYRYTQTQGGCYSSNHYWAWLRRRYNGDSEQCSLQARNPISTGAYLMPYLTYTPNNLGVLSIICFPHILHAIFHFSNLIVAHRNLPAPLVPFTFLNTVFKI